MTFPWTIIIAVVVLLLALTIKLLLSEIVEAENVFLCIVGGFFLIYIAAAIMIGFLDPKRIANQDSFLENVPVEASSPPS